MFFTSHSECDILPAQRARHGSLSIPSRVELGTPEPLAAEQQTYRKQKTKKTIIALMALAGVAMGVETLVKLDSEKLAISTVSVNGSDTITTDNKPLTFSVNEKTTLSSYIFTFGYDSLSGGSKDPWLRLDGGDGCGISTNSNSTMVLRSGYYSIIENTQLDYNTSNTFALTVGQGTVYLSNLTTGTYISTSLTTDAISNKTWDFQSNAARIYTNGGANQIQVGQIADLSGLTAAQVREVATTGSYTVPEPTTATLSLLALSALAARRRRR